MLRGNKIDPVLLEQLLQALLFSGANPQGRRCERGEIQTDLGPFV